ncbi:MAG: hypothetical protein LKE43_00100 [Olsenella sp.]|nr:hypothetical protein [Olsenella sp.]
MARKIRAELIMELREQGMSRRSMAKTRRMSMESACEVSGIAEERGIGRADVEPLTDEEACRLFCPGRGVRESVLEDPDWGYVRREMAKVGVNLRLPHDEYGEGCRREGKVAMGHTRFCGDHGARAAANSLTKRIEHKAGQPCEADWSGPTLGKGLVSPVTGEASKIHLFVGVLPLGQKACFEPTLDMKERAWLRCHVHIDSASLGFTRLTNTRPNPTSANAPAKPAWSRHSRQLGSAPSRRRGGVGALGRSLMAEPNADGERGAKPDSSEVAGRHGVDGHAVSKHWDGGGLCLVKSPFRKCAKTSLECEHETFWGFVTPTRQCLSAAGNRDGATPLRGHRSMAPIAIRAEASPAHPLRRGRAARVWQAACRLPPGSPVPAARRSRETARAPLRAGTSHTERPSAHRAGTARRRAPSGPTRSPARS